MCAAITCLAWSPNDDILLTGGADRDCGISLWSTFSGTLITTLKQHKHGISGCAWTPDGTRFVTGSTDQTMLEFKLDGTLVHTYQSIRAIDLAITHVLQPSPSVSPSASSVSLALGLGVAAGAGAAAATMQGAGSNGATLSKAAGKAKAEVQHYMLVVVCHARKLRLYDMNTHELLHVMQETSAITSLALSRDGRFALLNVCSEVGGCIHHFCS